MMASRSVGFRKIDNDVFKALIAAKLTGAGYQIVLTVMDKTLGFQKEKATISLTHFERITGLSRQSVRLAIKQAEDRRIITAERNSTRPTTYALNLRSSEWLTGKVNHPSLESNQLGNQITPDWETKSPQTRKPVISRTTDIKETLKETLKERGTSNIITSVRGDTPLTNSPTLREDDDDSIRLIIDYLRGIPEGNSWAGIVRATRLDGLVVSDKLCQYEGELFLLSSSGRWQLINRGISEDEPVNSITKIEPTTGEGTYRERITFYLGAHGPATIKTIIQATGIKANSVNWTLHKGKGKYFRHLRKQQAWDVARDGGKP